MPRFRVMADFPTFHSHTSPEHRFPDGCGRRAAQQVSTKISATPGPSFAPLPLFAAELCPCITFSDQFLAPFGRKTTRYRLVVGSPRSPVRARSRGCPRRRHPTSIRRVMPVSPPTCRPGAPLRAVLSKVEFQKLALGGAAGVEP